MKYKLICPYCGNVAQLKDSILIYKSKSYGQMYICSNYPKCDAYVGVHKGTDEPLGRLANETLRKLKIRVHAELDPLWRGLTVKRRTPMTRDEAYTLLANLMGLEHEETHVGLFDENECQEAIYRLKQYKTKYL